MYLTKWNRRGFVLALITAANLTAQSAMAAPKKVPLPKPRPAAIADKSFGTPGFVPPDIGREILAVIEHLQFGPLLGAQVINGFLLLGAQTKFFRNAGTKSIGWAGWNRWRRHGGGSGGGNRKAGQQHESECGDENGYPGFHGWGCWQQ